MPINQNTQIAYKDLAWFGTNAEITLKSGMQVYYLQTGLYKLGDGVTKLSSLVWLGGVVPAPSPISSGSEKGITASTTQTQAAAYQLTKKTNRIDACANDLDGVKVFAATENNEFYIQNATAKKAYAYPTSGERFRQGLNLLAIDQPIVVPSRTVLAGYCYEGETGIFTIK